MKQKLTELWGKLQKFKIMAGDLSTPPSTTDGIVSLFGLPWRSLCGCCCLVHLSAIPWTVAHQAPLSVRFSRQEYWSGLPFPSPGDLPDPGTEPWLLYHQATWETQISVGLLTTQIHFSHFWRPEVRSGRTLGKALLCVADGGLFIVFAHGREYSPNKHALHLLVTNPIIGAPPTWPRRPPKPLPWVPAPQGKDIHRWISEAHKHSVHRKQIGKLDCHILWRLRSYNCVLI